MKKLVVLVAAVFAVSAWFISHEASAEGTDILKAKGCTNCHDPEKKKVGPSLKDIAAKKPDVAATAAKLTSGKGHPKVNATEAEAKAAVEAAVATK